MRARTRQIRPGGFGPVPFLLLAWLLTFVALRETRAANVLEPGLAVTFTTADNVQPKTSDVAVLPSVQLYVPAGNPPTPFLPGGRFSADWVGFISSDIRDHYTFQADLNGDLKLEINGALVWEASVKGTNVGPGKPVRLNKGTNSFKVHFTSPSEGDAWVRLGWSSKEFAPEPIALSALTHAPTPELQHASRLRFGRELFIEFRCAKCHSGPAPDAGIPELAMDAPALYGIGSRRNYVWMARWIADPKALRPTAHMPKLFRGPKGKEDAEAVASFLASLKSESRELKEPAADQVQEGQKHFETLHCIACHTTPKSSKARALISPTPARARRSRIFTAGCAIHCASSPRRRCRFTSTQKGKVRWPIFTMATRQSRLKRSGNTSGWGTKCLRPRSHSEVRVSTNACSHA